MWRLTFLTLLGTWAVTAVKVTLDEQKNVEVTHYTKKNQDSAVWKPDFPVIDVADDNKISEHARIMKIPLHQLPASHDWFGDLMVGTPPQKLTVMFDSMSSDVWVPNRNFGDLHHFYNHNASSTYKANGTAFEYARNVSGFLSQDILTIGEVTLKNQLFGEVNETSGLGPAYPMVSFDGVFGLGFEDHSVDGIETPFHRLYRNGLLGEPVFAFYLPDGKPGELVFGASDKQHYTGEITYANTISADQWVLRLDSVEVSSHKFTFVKQVFISPLGQSIIGPKADVDALADFLGVDEYAVIDCDVATADISFIIDSVTYVLTRDDYIIKVREDLCVFGIIGFDFVSPVGPAWFLGGQFMQKYYTVFDFGTTERSPRIGFASAAI